MKNLKHIILSILLLGAVSPSFAQNKAGMDVKALTGALAETIRKFDTYADTLAYRIAWANHKNPTVLLGIAEAYNMNQNYPKTKQYAMEALKVQPDFAPSYVLLGKHCQYKFEHYADNEIYRDSAIYYYQKAIELNPLYPDSYGYYADLMQQTDPEGVLKKYLSLHDQRPDLPIMGTIGALQFAIAVKDTTDNKINLLKKSIDTYDTAGKENLTVPELQKYCDVLDYTSDIPKEDSEKNEYREKLLQIATSGHETEPTNPTFLSYMESANTKLTNYDAAIAAAEELFTKADTATTHYHYMPYDYRYYGISLMSAHTNNKDSLDLGVDRILEGVKVGEKMADDLGVSFRERSLAAAQVNSMHSDVTNIVNAMMARGDYEGAKHLREYQMSKKDSVTIDDWKNIAQVAFKKMQAATDSLDKQMALQELLEVYTKIENQYPNDASTLDIYYNHAAAMSQYMESTPKTGAAKAIFTKLLNLEASNPARTSTDDQYYAVAAQYLGMYYFYNNDYAQARHYAQIMMQFDVTYSVGEQILKACGGSGSSKKRKK